MTNQDPRAMVFCFKLSIQTTVWVCPIESLLTALAANLAELVKFVRQEGL